MRTIQVLAACIAIAACGSSGTAPSPSSVAVTVTASPATISATACGACGAGSTDREAATTIVIQETAGVAGAVSLIDMSLREQGTNTVLASGSFDGAAVTQLAGSNRVAARGSLSVRCGVHYAAGLGGRTATLVFTVRVTDDRGNQVTQTLNVATTT